MITTTINKPVRFTRQTTSAIDLIITNSVMHSGFISGIIKSSSLINFTMHFCYKCIAKKEDAKNEFIYKLRFSDQSIGTFQSRLCDINRSKVSHCGKANKTFINFLSIIDPLFGECFPVAKIR